MVNNTRIHERLTDRRLLGEGYYIPKNKDEMIELTHKSHCSVGELYDRLGELENAIEEGRLVPVNVAPIVSDGALTVCGYCHESIEFPHWKYCPSCGSLLKDETGSQGLR